MTSKNRDGNYNWISLKFWDALVGWDNVFFLLSFMLRNDLIPKIGYPRNRFVFLLCVLVSELNEFWKIGQNGWYPVECSE